MRLSRLSVLAMLALVMFAAVLAGRSLACPFCSGVSITLGEEMKAASAAVIARLVEGPQEAAAADPAHNLAKFEIVQVLKGKEILGDQQQIEVIYFGQDEKDKPFLIMGVDSPQVVWNTPIALTERGSQYVARLPELPESGPDRLAYFQEYFEDAEEMLARDAYDEFAKAPYAEVQGLKDRMHHDKLIAWIKNPQVSPSRRRLYLTMLGVCGSKDDLPMLEEFIKSDDRDMKTALDATIACYLILAGPDGLSLVEERFLKNPDAEYTDTYAAIMALRFHGQETTVIPKERLAKSLEYMLDRPQLADLVIPDLARWEDWGVMDRLVTLFKEANEETSWVRVPVINFLKVCPDPRAKEHLDELAKIDPDAVKRATSAFPFAGSVPAPVPVPDTASATAPEAQLAESPDPDPSAAGTAEVSVNRQAAGAVSDEGSSPAKLAAATGSREPLVEPPRFANTPAWLVVVIPIVAGGLLLGILLVVLRGQRRQANT
jgi:hypothetical protein